MTSLYGGVAAGAVAAAIVTGRALARRRMHLLDLAGLGYFLVLGAVLVTIHPAHLDYWSRYAQAGSHAALTLIVFGCILIGHPFTESYARKRHQPRCGTPTSSARSTGASRPCGAWRSWLGPSP